MKKTVFRILRILAVFMLIVTIAFTYFMYFIPSEGKLIKTYVSNDEKYQIDVYLYEPALSNDAVKCVIKYNTSGIQRNIYYQYGIRNVDVKWTGNDTVEIGGHNLNVFLGKYDFRWASQGVCVILIILLLATIVICSRKIRK